MKNLKAPLLVSLTGLVLVACNGGGGNGDGRSLTYNGWEQVGDSNSFASGEYKPGKTFIYDIPTNNIYFNTFKYSPTDVYDSPTDILLCGINESANSTVVPTCVSITKPGFTIKTDPVGDSNGSIYWIANSSTKPYNSYIFKYDTLSGTILQGAQIDSTVVNGRRISSYNNNQIFIVQSGYELIGINVLTGITAPYLSSFASGPNAFTVESSTVYFIGSSSILSIYAQAQQSNVANIVGSNSMPINGFGSTGIYINNNILYACPSSIDNGFNEGAAYLNTSGDNVWSYLPPTSSITPSTNNYTQCGLITTDAHNNVFSAGGIYVKYGDYNYDMKWQIMKYNR